MKTEEKHTSPEEYKRKNEVDGVEVPRKSGEGTMMEQSPEMIGGAGRQTHLMRSFVSRHNHLALLGISVFSLFSINTCLFLIFSRLFTKYIYHRGHSILESSSHLRDHLLN